MQYVTVSVVKQVPSYSKHCTKVGGQSFFPLVCGICKKTDQVDDTKCKTVFKNAFTTQMETQVLKQGLG